MNVIVQSKTMTITQALQDFATKQARKFGKSGRNIGQVVVFLESVRRKKNDMQAATAKFFIDIPGKNIVVQERAKDIYQAINDAANNAVRQLHRAKERKLVRRLKFQPVG
jgi:ribosomal subunit interface protein